MRIKKKLPLIIFLLVSLPLVLLSIILYHYTSQSVIEISKNQMKQTALLGGKGISDLIGAQKREVELMAQLEDVVEFLNEGQTTDTVNKKSFQLKSSIDTLLIYRLEKSPELQNVFIVNKEGNIIATAQNEILDVSVTDRIYYKEVMSGKISVSNVLVSKLAGERIIVTAAPVKNEKGEIIGLIANSINMIYFNNYLSNIDVGNNGYSYLVDSEGRIISHPDVEKIGELAENDKLKNLLIMQYGQERKAVGVDSYIYRGIDKYMGYSFVPEINWVLVVTQNASDMRKNARIVLYIILITAFLVLAIALKFGLNFSKSIINPINQLTLVMSKAASGDSTSKCNYRSRDEFGELSENFNIMIDKLNSSYEELASTYEELMATEEELRAQYEELQSSEEALRSSEEKYKLALEGANDVIWEWDLLSNNFFISDKWIELTGHKKIKNLDLNYIQNNIIHPDDYARAARDLKKHLNGETEYYQSEFRIKFWDGAYKWIFNRGKALKDSRGSVIKLAGSITDISERKKAEEQMRLMAYYDKLTNLPNRTYFMDKFKRKLKKSKQNSTIGALFFIDLDNFKNVNDTLGHEYGDKLLALISKKFESIKGQSNIVSRFGGDEFLMLQSSINSENEVVSLAKEILGVFNDTFRINDKHIYITGSIGIAIYPRDGEETGVLLKNADAAMYRAKELGKNKYMFFNNDIYNHLQRKIKIENILRHAIESNELQVYYQPQYNINSKRICGFEALLRLNSKELGFIPPDEFIAVAEENGMIVEIGEWCIRRVCEDNKKWKDMGYTYDFIAVNISSVQLQQANFAEMVEGVLKKTGLKARYLEIELTETILMKSLDYSIDVLNKIRDMGIKIALDDFGTGYSSLNYLRKIPIDVLKIDKSFIDGIGIDYRQEAIVDGIIQIAHEMELQVVAEGVEAQYQLDLLMEKKCDKIQGYLISKPVPKDDAEQLLKSESYNRPI